ncbi:HRDC-like protein [Entophlyctis helioformis]|nr:HRDC-like protein [Entophlyctis helioformis]
MDVVDHCSALLSNYEVLTLMKTNFAKHNSTAPRQSAFIQDLRTIEYEVIKYLEASPVAGQSPDQIQGALAELKSWKLTKAEKLMLINLRPTTRVEVSAVLEECETRLNDDELGQLLEILDRHLPYSKPVVAYEEAAEDMQAEDA